ncbi:hypothetical protein [Bradyrhizobium icense]|uniref:hypothetical protein n=1 Tax=Bradyrhizobium icense TaxID=1274631 RepID=UPI0018D451C1|nr:hypothetical protein [Bradyrhizobium icense]
MDYDREINALAAETLAIQTILAQVLRRLSSASPETSILIRHGLDDASNILEHLALQHGRNVSPEHLAKAVRVAEELRTSILGQDTPGGKG